MLLSAQGHVILPSFALKPFLLSLALVSLPRGFCLEEAIAWSSFWSSVGPWKQELAFTLGERFETRRFFA